MDLAPWDFIKQTEIKKGRHMTAFFKDLIFLGKRQNSRSIF